MDLFIISIIAKPIFTFRLVMADVVLMAIRKLMLTTFVARFMDRVTRQLNIQEERIKKVVGWVFKCTRERIVCRMEKTFMERVVLDINVRFWFLLEIIKACTTLCARTFQVFFVAKSKEMS